MSQASKQEYLKRIYPRYEKAEGKEKQRILDEFCANCGYHRKHAIRVLNGPAPGEKPRRKRQPRKVTYGSRVISILKAVWEAADYPWSVRLHALLPEWLPWIRLHFRLTAELERQMLAISARTIDYRLRAHKGKLRRRLYGRTKPGTLLKHHIPLKTDHGNVQIPGFTEIDLVSHSGNCATGEFCYSLNVTDIYTGWTEMRAVLGRGQEAVRQALEEIRQALPFPLRGIDSDNGSEFINEHLLRYCRARAIQFTRGRPYKKDDNAHIEQKNWTHVRRILGYVRYDTEAAREAINDLYRGELRRFQNLFLPSVKLAKKERVGSRLRRRYEAPQTPGQRVVTSPVADPERVAELRQERARLDPFQLSRRIQEKLERIFRLSRDTRAPAAAPGPVNSERHRPAPTARNRKRRAKLLPNPKPRGRPPRPRSSPRRTPVPLRGSEKESAARLWK
jgi:integrase-like protein